MAALVGLAAGPAAATTYVLPPDEALLRDAAVVAQVSVTAVEPSPIPGPPSTDYFVQVERVLKGFVAGGTVVVRVPGGIGPDGLGLRIWGAPEFREGERALLFLVPRRDGTYGVLHLMLGAFYEVEARGRRVALRALAEAVEVSLAGDGDRLAGFEPLRDYQGFVDWIEAFVGGDRREVDYLLDAPAGALRRMVERSGLLEERCTGLGFRWPQIDAGEAVPWKLDDRTLAGGAGRRAFDRARRAWSQATRGVVRFTRAGRTRTDAGLVSLDDDNGVLFGDRDQVAAGAFRCPSGGLVSVSGIWFDNGRGQSCEWTGPGRKCRRRGRDYLEVLGADVVVNDGAECLFRGDSAAGARVLAHELGHALGLAHDDDPDGLMWGEVRDGWVAPRGVADSPLSRIYRLRRPSRR